MNFNQGDLVVHKNFGVGKVKSVEGVDFNESGSRPYYRVDFAATTVWVAVGEQPKGGLRPLTPKAQLKHYRTVLKSAPQALDEQFRKRHAELVSRLEAGSFQAVCEVVRDLSARAARKPLSSYEKNLLAQTRDLLSSEWAVASGLSQAEALSEIETCLLAGRSSV